jgi:ribosome biogenesis SPOUT family RNA methylase Rps3
MGMKAEMEHTESKSQAKRMAMDHLAENPKYYTKLKKAKLEESFNKYLLNESKLGLFINAKTNFS